MMTSCEGSSVLMGLSCLNQLHLGPIYPLPQPLELHLSSALQAFLSRAGGEPVPSIGPCFWLPGCSPDFHCGSLLQQLCFRLGLHHGPGSDTAGSLASNPISWMDFGPMLQVTSIALSSCSSLGLVGEPWP